MRHTRIVVTGGCGFIGSALVRHLVRTGIEVLCIDALTYAADQDAVAEVAQRPNFQFLRFDICDRSRVEAALREFKPSALIHLAAETHVDRSIDSPAQFLRTNVEGTFNLLEATRSYWRTLSSGQRDDFRFLHVSTDEVYGELEFNNQRFSETSPYAPSSPYSATKAASDHLVRAWHKTYGLPVVVSNCCNNYGPYQFPEKLIPTIILAAIEGKPLPVYGDGSNVRDWLYVDDHVQALVAMVEQAPSGSTYLVGASTEIRNIDLVSTICVILDELIPTSANIPHRQLISYVKDRPGHDLRYAVDATKLRLELGWAPKQDFLSNLRQTVAWYIENSQWQGRTRLSRYDGSRLGLSAEEHQDSRK